MALISLLEIYTYADSPITSTTISNAYADIPIVSKAMSKKVLDEDILEYMSKEENKILIEKGSIVIELVLNSNEAIINNEKKELEVSPQIINGRTYMPLRFISENLGGQVLWDDASKTISIKIGGKLNINYSDANSPGNIVNGKIAYYYNGYLYYQNGYSDGALYKMNLVDGKKERLIGGIPIDFVIYDGWIYYSDIGDNLAIYKVSIAGGSRISVKNLTGRYFNLVGENLIFQNMKSYGQIYKLNLNNESLVKMDNINHPSPITTDEEWIYYTYGGDINKLKKEMHLEVFI